MRARLVVTDGPDAGKSFALGAGLSFEVGRGLATPTALTDPTVSRLHCVLELDGERAVLLNVSASGTRVNGLPVTELPLRPGDQIRVGSTTLVFEVESADDAPAPPAPPSPDARTRLTEFVGRAFVHYAVEDVVAHGTSAVVFRASDTRDAQPVALKVLLPEFVRADEDRQRFVRAIKTVLPVRHPHLVSTLAAGKSGRHCWIAMEFVEGDNLTALAAKAGVDGRLEWHHALRVAVHVARGLSHAHGQNILHRNLTPRNVLLRKKERTAVVGDLMLAKALEEAPGPTLTRPGTLIGDLAYMAPERTHDAPADARSDLYGLGAVIYSMLTGQPPAGTGSVVELVGRIRDEPPAPPRSVQPAIPEAFENVVLRLLAKRPGDRYQTADELLGALDPLIPAAGVRI